MAAKAQKKKRGIFWKILIVTFGVLLVLFAAGFTVAMLLFGNVPQLETDPLQPEDYQLMNKLAGRLAGELLSGDGAPEESELVLSPGEVNSFVRILDNGVDLRNMLTGKGGGNTRIKNHNIRYENGRFELLVPVKTKLTWLRGGVIMADMSVKPGKDGDNLTLDISRARAGSISLPGFLVDRLRENAVNTGRLDENYRKLDRCIKSVRIDSDHNLHIVYRPRELRKLLQSGLVPR